jgi:excisionase family DNA binding protein
MERLLLRPGEVAEVIGVGRSKVYELLAKGELPAVRVGSLVRVPVDQLKEWIQERVVAAADSSPRPEENERRKRQAR